jgi:hypothetical protein
LQKIAVGRAEILDDMGTAPDVFALANKTARSSAACFCRAA